MIIRSIATMSKGVHVLWHESTGIMPSFVASASRWKALGRAVKSDGNPIIIFAPRRAIHSRQCVYFVVAPIYDISQTTSAPLPNYLVKAFKGKFRDRWLENLIEFASYQNIEIVYEGARLQGA